MEETSHLIGMFCDTPMVGSGYLAMLLVGLMAGCRKWDCTLAIKAFDFSEPDIAEKMERVHRRSPLRGAVLPEPLCDRSDLVDALRAIGLPVVRIAPHREAGGTFDICIDHRRAAYDLTRHLIALGHKRIGFVKGPKDHGDAIARLAGFRQAMEEAGIAVIEALCVQAETFDYSSGLTPANQLLSADPRPTAVFACNDELAAAVLETAFDRGLRVPDDFSLAGFDDAPLARIVRPQLTTCRQKMELTGYSAIDFIMNPPTSQEGFRRVQQHELVMRASTAPPKA